MKRHLLGCMIVMLALLLVMLAGCGHTDKENTTTSTTLTEEGTTLPSDSVTSESNTGNQGDEPAVLTLTLMENGATNFKVIRAESASNEISLSAITLRTTLNDLTGGKFGIASDWSKTIDQDAQEIVVGHTNRTDEIAFRAELKEKGAVCVRNQSHREKSDYHRYRG